MLQLNVRLQNSEMPPLSRSVVIIRTAARSLKIVLKSLFQRVRGRRAVDTEEGAGEEKTAENALEEYHQILQNTFGSSDSKVSCRFFAMPSRRAVIYMPSFVTLQLLLQQLTIITH